MKTFSYVALINSNIFTVGVWATPSESWMHTMSGLLCAGWMLASAMGAILSLKDHNELHR